MSDNTAKGISMNNWFSVDVKPEHHQEVLVMMWSSDPNHIDLKIVHSMYFNGQIIQGWGDSWNEEGFLDESQIMLWKPLTLPSDEQFEAAKKAYDESMAF